MNGIEISAMYAIVIAELILLGRLLYLGLYRRYKWFAALAAADLVQTVAGLLGILPLYSASYWWFWTLSEAALAALQALAAREVCTRIRDSYPGMGRVAQQITECVFVVALLICLATLFIDARLANWHSTTWSASLVLRRAIATVLALTVGSVALLIRGAPAPVPPNVKRHAWMLAGYLAVIALFPFLIATRLLRPEAASPIMLVASALIFAGWIAVFRRGEDEAKIPPFTISVEQLRETERDLASLAGQLGRIAHRLFH
jgi:hypothetical protein